MDKLPHHRPRAGTTAHTVPLRTPSTALDDVSHMTHLQDATHSRSATVHPAVVRMQVPWPLHGASTVPDPGHASKGCAVGETAGDGDGDVLGTPGVAAGGDVGEAAGLELGSSQWVPVAPVPVQSHTGPMLPTTHTPGPHTIEEQPVTCETWHTQITVLVVYETRTSGWVDSSALITMYTLALQD
jgi:hypothetical protein